MPASRPARTAIPALPSMVAIAAAALTACGGGGAPESSAGQSPCVETAIVTSGTGSFSCTLKPGEAAPFFVAVTDPAGMVRPLVSVATSTAARWPG